MRSTIAGILSTFLLLIAIPAQAQDYQGDALDVIDRSDDVDYTADLFLETGLSADVEGDEYTIFVPTDRAWGDLPADLREHLLDPDNRDDLREVLAYHVVEDAYYADDIVAAGEAYGSEPRLATLSGEDVLVNDSQSGVLVGDAAIIRPDVGATNGVVHVIDKVLLPPSIDAESMAH